MYKNPIDYNVFKDIKKCFRQCGFEIYGESHLERNYLEVASVHQFPKDGMMSIISIVYHLNNQHIEISIWFIPPVKDYRKEWLLESIKALPEPSMAKNLCVGALGDKIKLTSDFSLIDRHLDKAAFQDCLLNAIAEAENIFPLLNNYWLQTRGLPEQNLFKKEE